MHSYKPRAKPLGQTSANYTAAIPTAPKCKLTNATKIENSPLRTAHDLPFFAAAPKRDPAPASRWCLLAHGRLSRHPPRPCLSLSSLKPAIGLRVRSSPLQACSCNSQKSCALYSPAYGKVGFQKRKNLRFTVYPFIRNRPVCKRRCAPILCESLKLVYSAHFCKLQAVHTVSPSLYTCALIIPYPLSISIWSLFRWPSVLHMFLCTLTVVPLSAALC